jgi:HSP20 family protein
MSKRKKETGPSSGFELGVGGLFHGLSDLLGKLADLAEKGGELRREGTLGGKGGEGLKGVFGFTVKVGGLGKDQVQVEPFGNLRRSEGGETMVAEEREPVVDVFKEKDHVLVVAELPGVEDSEVTTRLKGDVLLIAAEGKNRKYKKEVLLPRRFLPSDLSRSFHNGILEIRLKAGLRGQV